MLLSGLFCWGLAQHARAEVQLPESLSADPIVVTAEAANHWRQGENDLWIVRGNCRIQQGKLDARCGEGVLWITPEDPDGRRPRKITAYLEGDVTVDVWKDDVRTRLSDKAWLGALQTRTKVDVRTATSAGEPTTSPAIYERAVAARSPQTPGVIQRTQYAAPVRPPAAVVATSGARRIRVFPRSETPMQFQWFPDPATNQWIAVIDQGVQVIVDGLDGAGGMKALGNEKISSIDVSTDRLVLWTNSDGEPDLKGQTGQSADTPLEIYMEGNIVFREGERTIYADRMYYDVRRRAGTIINAEVLTPAPKFDGLVRLRTRLLQQLGPDKFYAEDSFFTSSRMGMPGYRVQAGDVTFEDIQTPVIDPLTGQTAIDPDTNEPIVEHERLASGRNAFLFLGEAPVAYWPWLATDLDHPTYYLKRLGVRNDTIFGTQVLTAFDAYQLLGVRKPPEGTEWDLSLDYLSKRGFGHGTNFNYVREGMLGQPGAAAGMIDYWGIHDSGTDTLGGNRVGITPETAYRYRFFGQHRQELPNDFQLRAELGLISDRNFLEEYYKREWDEFKDQTTTLQLRRQGGNVSWQLWGQYRTNDFFTDSDWLPRLDHYWLGQSLLEDRLTWYEHTSLGYGRLHAAEAPNPGVDPIDYSQFAYLPWEPNGGSLSGERLFTRQELDYPFALGPVKFVPYVEGEAADWGADINGQRVQRLFGQTGLRASMPMWAVYPEAESSLWNVHGLAHKTVFQAEFAFAEANRSLDDLPLYDPLDDTNIEEARRRYAFNTFGHPLVGTSPVAPTPWLRNSAGTYDTAYLRRFDERYYALRSGMSSWITSPTAEIADDLMTFRMGARQRWQTKRGAPGRQHILDWITLDTNVTFFPNDERDNFGRLMGLADYDFRWHVGDRLSLLSDGVFDFFPGGQKVMNFGAFLTRPPRGSLYVGLNYLDGPIHAAVISASYSYWMSPKWITSLGTSTDLARQANVGQSITLTRVGESFLVSAGFHVDAIRGDVGANFMIEPRFMPKGRLGSVGGAHVPTAGAYGLE